MAQSNGLPGSRLGQSIVCRVGATNGWFYPPKLYRCNLPFFFWELGLICNVWRLIFASIMPCRTFSVRTAFSRNGLMTRQKINSISMSSTILQWMSFSYTSRDNARHPFPCWTNVMIYGIQNTVYWSNYSWMPAAGYIGECCVRTVLKTSAGRRNFKLQCAIHHHIRPAEDRSLSSIQIVPVREENGKPDCWTLDNSLKSLK